MSLFRKLVAVAGAAEAARRYAKSNPDKAARYVDQAADFVDKQTKGKYKGKISGVAGKVKGVAGIDSPTYGGHTNGYTNGHPSGPSGYGSTGSVGDRQQRPGS